MNPADYFSQNNLAASNFSAVEKQSVNLVFLTDDFVLRVVRPELVDYVNHEREAKLGLKAFKLGVKTAKPVAWDETYSIWERLPGQPLQNPETCSPDVWVRLLESLELLHKNPLEPLGEPAKVWTGDSSFIDKTQEVARWSAAERTRLNALLSEPHPIRSPCYIHGDAYADNIMVADGSFVGIIDWGNAGWYSLEAECSSLEAPALDLALDRWQGSLDTALLWKMRLNLLLEVASYGRVPVSEVRAALQQLNKAGL